jgi:TolA-binding protein
MSLILLTLLAVSGVPPSEELYLKAMELKASGQPDEAAELFQRLVEEHPDSDYAPSALVVWGEVAETKENPVLAMELYRRLLKDYPEHRLARSTRTRLDIMEKRANLDGVEGRYQELLEGYAAKGADETIVDVEALVEAHPNHHIVPRAECWLGNQYRQKAKFDLSVEHYSLSLEANPDSECARRALDHMGNIALNRGDLGDARAAFESLPDHGETGAASAAYNMDKFRHVWWTTRVWQLFWVVGLAGLIAVGVGFPWRQLRPKHALAVLAPAAAMGAALFLVGAFGGSSLRTLLLPVSLGMAPLAGLAGLLRVVPSDRPWHRKAWPIVILWLCLATIYGSLFLLEWL